MAKEQKGSDDENRQYRDGQNTGKELDQQRVSLVRVGFESGWAALSAWDIEVYHGARAGQGFGGFKVHVGDGR